MNKDIIPVTHIFYLPIKIILPRKKVKDKIFYLNLNPYIHYHNFTKNEAKQLFKPIKGELFKAEKIRITYFLEKKRRVLFDTRNTTAIVDKFFCDWLVKNGCIPDDNFMHVCHGGDDGIMGCITDRVIATVEILR